MGASVEQVKAEIRLRAAQLGLTFDEADIIHAFDPEFGDFVFLRRHKVRADPFAIALFEPFSPNMGTPPQEWVYHQLVYVQYTDRRHIPETWTDHVVREFNLSPTLQIAFTVVVRDPSLVCKIDLDGEERWGASLEQAVRARLLP